ncbi:MAG TPA: class I adenylate-forming enzyme family protein [Burkholderiaceae bacterium]|nr:class I adenylate-forming enzyme family protein [Burkholderiaceae bacterium]
MTADRGRSVHAFWSDVGLPAIRAEAHYGDRIVRCFADRPGGAHRMLEQAVAAHGERDAIVYEDRCWSWRELDGDIARVAGGLRACGIAAGDRVALLVSNRPEFVIGYWAALRLGAIAVPIGVREQMPGLQYILSHCDARALIFDAELADRVPPSATVPGLRQRIAVGGAARDGAESFDALLRADPVAAAIDTREEDTVTILYTSGTTGRPKGAMLTNLSIVHSAMHFQVCMQLTERDRSAMAVPASHVTGLIAMIVAMTRAGGALVIVPAFRAADFLALAERQRITHTILVPAMYNLCLLEPDFGRYDLSSLRIGGYGGAPMPQATISALAQRLPALTLTNAYGSTETTSPTTIMPAGQQAAHLDSVGVAVPCADVLVVDERGRELPPGQPGELWIGGPMVVAGYWNNPQATAESFTAGYWHSGDVGSIDAEGFVRVFDRSKDMLNRGGFKIYSVEVENVLAAFPGVVESAVVGRPCPVLGERVHAFVYGGGASLDAHALREHCAQQLADYKVPESFTFSDTPLPRNANGKLLKRMLRERLG